MPLKNNNSQFLWFVPEIGNILLKCNPRAKRLTLSISPNRGVRVTFPKFISLSEAKEFVLSKQNWVTEKLGEISQRRNEKIIASGYTTRTSTIIFEPHKTDKFKVIRTKQYTYIYHPIDVNNSNTQLQEIAGAEIDRIYRAEAKSKLPSRVVELACKFGFTYNNLCIKKTTSRWGSCSSKNNINLSIYLMKLPDDLVDYVILHELTHTIHKNHGPHFWNHLNRITGDAKGLAKRVKKYRTGV